MKIDDSFACIHFYKKNDFMVKLDVLSKIWFQKLESPSKIYNYEKDTIHKSSIFFHLTLNEFDTCEKSKPLVAQLASLVVSSFHLLFNQKNAYYTKKNMCFLFESCFN